jgi:hypothetical protein
MNGIKSALYFFTNIIFIHLLLRYEIFEYLHVFEEQINYPCSMMIDVISVLGTDNT